MTLRCPLAATWAADRPERDTPGTRTPAPRRPVGRSQRKAPRLAWGPAHRRTQPAPSARAVRPLGRRGLRSSRHHPGGGCHALQVSGSRHSCGFVDRQPVTPLDDGRDNVLSPKAVRRRSTAVSTAWVSLLLPGSTRSKSPRETTSPGRCRQRPQYRHPRPGQRLDVAVDQHTGSPDLDRVLGGFYCARHQRRQLDGDVAGQGPQPHSLGRRCRDALSDQRL